MVFFVRITVNQSHLRPICKSTKFNPKIQRTIYLINFQQLRLHVPDFIRTVVSKYIKECYRFSTPDEGIDFIIRNFSDEYHKNFLYLNTDFGIQICDKRYDELKKGFFFFNSGGQIV